MDKEPQLPLAPRDLLILSVLAEGPLHGYGIIKAVEEWSGSDVFLDPANLYRALRRMRSLGWVREVEPDSIGGQNAPSAAPRRKTHSITSGGRAILSAEVARLERLLDRTRPALADGDGG